MTDLDADGHPELLVAAYGRIHAYDVDTGRLLWSSAALGATLVIGTGELKDGGAPEVVVSADARDVGAELAGNLEEDGPEVVALLCKCVQLLGEAEARQLVVQTWQTENAGGLLTQDGSNRRRTPGGVFLWLVKQKLSSADRARLFRRPA